MPLEIQKQRANAVRDLAAHTQSEQDLTCLVQRPTCQLAEGRPPRADYLLPGDRALYLLATRNSASSKPGREPRLEMNSLDKG
jgi:hypothetical protein